MPVNMGLGKLGDPNIIFTRKWRWTFAADFGNLSMKEIFVKVNTKTLVINGPAKLSIECFEVEMDLVLDFSAIFTEYQQELQTGVGRLKLYDGTGILLEDRTLHGLAPVHAVITDAGVNSTTYACVNFDWDYYKVKMETINDPVFGSALKKKPKEWSPKGGNGKFFAST